MFIRIAAVLCLLPALLQDRAPAKPDTQIMDWVFAMPEGWRAANGRLRDLEVNELVLEHKDRASHALTQLAFGEPVELKGTFRDWFDGHWENLKKDYTFPALEAPTEADTARGYRMIAGAGLAHLGENRQRLVMLAAISKGTRAGLFCFITEDFEHYEANVARLDALIGSATFASLRPKDEKAPALKTRIHPLWTPSFTWGKDVALPAGDSPLEGLYALQTGVPERMGSGETVIRSGYRYLLFLKDGRVFNRMPPEGLLSFDIDYWKQEFASNVGTYTVEGDIVTVVTKSDRLTFTSRLTRKGGDLIEKESAFKPLQDEKPDLRGRYMKTERHKHAERFHKGITFGADGRFEDEGFNAMLDLRWWCGDYFWIKEPSALPGKGTWRVAKHTLELLYEDGRKRRFGFHVHENEGGKGAKYIVLNGHFLDRLE
jgi:hypothetical protein